MKILKKILSIVILFAVSSLSAKQTAKKSSRPAAQPKPIPTQINRQPIPQQQPTTQGQSSYAELVTYIKNAANVWDNATAKLRSDFVTTIVQKARALGLEDFQLEALLQTARDMHGIFSGNPTRDIALLQSLDTQISTAIRQQ